MIVDDGSSNDDDDDDDSGTTNIDSNGGDVRKHEKMYII